MNRVAIETFLYAWGGGAHFSSDSKSESGFDRCDYSLSREKFDEHGTLFFTREGFDDFYVGKGSTYPDFFWLRGNPF